MINLKKIILLFVLFSLCGIKGYAQSPEDIFSRKTGSIQLSINALAFEYCTCTFIMEQDQNFCRKYVFEGIPLPPHLFSVKVNRDQKTVKLLSRLSLGILKSSASFTEELGCQFNRK